MNQRILLTFIFFPLFLLVSEAQIKPPYIQDFESNTEDWSLYPRWEDGNSWSNGTSDWTLGTPIKNNLKVGSGTRAWVTRLSGMVTTNAITVLQSPAFDLSDTSEIYVLSFYHNYDISRSGSRAVVDYSLDGTNWKSLKDDVSGNQNWYNISQYSSSYPGFAGLTPTTEQVAVQSLRMFKGKSNVRFRFTLWTNNVNTQEGWLIDDFKITKERFNLRALPSDTTRNISKNFKEFSVKGRAGFSGFYQIPYGQSYYTRFYFSTDTILDASDIFLKEVAGINLEQTFTLPSNLSENAQRYYVLYQLDARNQIKENIETDNIGFIAIEMTSILKVPTYKDDLEGAQTEWTTSLPYIYANDTVYWERGQSLYPGIEGTHSGKYAWIIRSKKPLGLYPPDEHYLESPYLDFSSNEKNVFCFKYRTSLQQEYISARIHMSRTNGYANYNIGYNNNEVATAPIKKARINDWDCACYDLSFLTGHNNGRIRLASFEHHAVPPPIAIDNLYIGLPKPDISIQRNQEFITTTTQARDTLQYRIFNNGLALLPPTITHFYWSTDTIFDSTDILLGSKSEPSVNDTLFINTFFAFNKPTLNPGKYYLLYRADATQMIDEMWENNNQGYFEIVQRQVIEAPYFNDFEIHSNNWYTRSSIGKPLLWQHKEPTDEVKLQIPSGQKAWIANGYEGATTYDKRFQRFHLYTPVFDLTKVAHPVLEFDWQNYSAQYQDISTTYSISYSFDGGFTWTILDTTNQSFKGFYYGHSYDKSYGNDKISGGILGWDYLEGEKTLLFNNKYKNPEYQYIHRNNGTYYGRDSERDTHFILDIEFLKGKKNVQFRFNSLSSSNSYSKNVILGNGAVMDNFSITERYTDLAVGYHKNLYLSPLADTLRFFMSIKNKGNYLASASKYHYYLSSDTLVDTDDYKLTDDSNYLPMIRPDMSYYLQAQFKLPNQWSKQYKYLLYHLDADQKVSESNERNNIGYWTLKDDKSISIPYFNDFEKEHIDGWAWYTRGPKSNQRFRHRVVTGEPTFFTRSGEWFLDLFNENWSSYFYPTYYLESPAFDLSTVNTGIHLSFDFVCYGTARGPYGFTGGNIQYTIDGGKSWKVLGRAYEYGNIDSLGSNWYTVSGIESLNGEAGWAQRLPSQAESGLNTAAYDITFLRGEADVQFRFQFRSSHHDHDFGAHGFRMDNFRIEAAPPKVLGQTITFKDIANITYGDSAIALIAHASSHLPIQFEVVSGNAIIDGNTLTATGAGDVVVRATQVGNFNYRPATPVEKTFTVARASQHIQMLPITDKAIGAMPFKIPVIKGKSTKPVRFNIAFPSRESVYAIIQNDTLTPNNMGMVTVQATQEGDANYTDAPIAEITFCVRPAKPIITAEFSLVDSVFIITTNANLQNEWFFNGSPIPNSNTNSWYTNIPGRYQVQITGPCGAPQISDALDIGVTAVEDILSSQIIVYPNPSNENTLVVFPEKLTVKKMTLIGSQGKQLQYYEGKISQKQLIKLQGLPPGLYLLRIETIQGIANKKIIIAR